MSKRQHDLRCAAVLLALAVALGCSGSQSPDTDWSKEHQRLRDLGEFGAENDDDITLALERIESGPVSERVLAAWALGEIRHQAAEPKLRAALDDEDGTVRANAAGALLKLGVPDWIELTARGLADPDPFTQQATLSLMPEFTSPELVEPISKLLANSATEAVRIGAADALGLTRDAAGVVTALASGIDDESKDVRVHVVFALGKIKHPEAIPLLTGLLADEAWEVRANAVQALGNYPTAQTLDAIRPLLEDSNAQVRGVAASILGR